MSLHTELDIYKAADQLLGLALDVQTQIPRAYRVAIGQRISNECADILLTVARANVARDAARLVHVDSLIERLEAATVFLRASYNKRLIPLKVWSASIELTDSISKQAHGWRKATVGKISAAPAA